MGEEVARLEKLLDEILNRYQLYEDGPAWAICKLISDSRESRKYED